MNALIEVGDDPVLKSLDISIFANMLGNVVDCGHAGVLPSRLRNGAALTRVLRELYGGG